LLAQLPEWFSQLVDQSGDAGGKVEGSDIGGQIVLKFLLDLTHPLGQIFGMFREAHRGRGGNQALSAAHEQFSMELVSEIVQLKTDRAETGRLSRRRGSCSETPSRQEKVRAGEYP